MLVKYNSKNHILHMYLIPTNLQSHHIQGAHNHLLVQNCNYLNMHMISLEFMRFLSNFHIF